MKRLINIVLVGSILLGIIITNYSCQPESAPKAIVQVVDENNEPIEGAIVCVKAINSDDTHTIVYLEGESKTVEDVQYSDKDGFTIYDFKYESIYRVEVTVEPDYHNDEIRRGIGVLILENDKIEEIKVVVNEQTVF